MLQERIYRWPNNITSRVETLTQAPSQPKYKLAQPDSALAAAAAEKSAVTYSKFLAALLATLAIGIANVTIYPVSFLRADLVPAKISSKGRAERAADYFYNSENPAVVLLGSSLIFRASFETDKDYEHIALPTKIEDLSEFKKKHVEAQHFERLMKEKFGKPYSTIELGIPASMISDQRAFVDKMVLFEKSPRLVISTIAPREFYDNAYKDPKETTAYEQISTSYPMTMWEHHPKAAWFYMTRHFQPLIFLCQTIDDVNVRAYTYRFKVSDAARTQLLRIFNQSTAPSTVSPENSITKFPQGNVAAAPKSPIAIASEAATAVAQKNAVAKAISAIPAPLERVLPDLECYRFSYNPPDYKQFDRNIDELKAMARACKRAGYVFVIVDMPVTDQNRRQMMPDALGRYRKELSEIAKDYGAKLIVPETRDNYKESDFGDSVHVTAPGGEKIFQCIVNSLFEDPQVHERLMQSHS
jgi:hypothetical protein